jgi:hypothetical protein
VQLSPFIFAREAAAYAGFGYEYFRKLQSRGETPALGRGRRGAKVRYTREGLDHWLLHRWDKRPPGTGRAA